MGNHGGVVIYGDTIGLPGIMGTENTPDNEVVSNFGNHDVRRY